MKKYTINVGLLILFFGVLLTNNLYAQMSAYRCVEKMTCGINVGRSFELDAGEPTDRLIQEYYFQDFKTAGFDFVRLPIQWNAHTGTAAPYTIDNVWMTRVEQVVDWSLKNGLITVINMHHDMWILENNSYTPTDLARFDAIWTQIALRFKDKSENLIFEIANEPNIAISSVDILNAHAIPIIRKTNPTRNIIFGSSGTQFSTLKQAKIPVDKYLIASFHTYEPWAFAGDGTGTWGTVTDIATVETMLASVDAWVETNNIPMLMGEFSSRSICDLTSRKAWFYTHMKSANRYNIAPCVWQDFGWFGLYYNTTNAANKWTTSVKDVIVAKYNQPAEALTIAESGNSGALLTWINRDVDYKSISIQRKEGTGTYTSVATLAGNVETYTNLNVVAGKTYTYRVVSTLSTGLTAKSFPSQITISTLTNVKPVLSFTNITNNDIITQGTDLNISVNATHSTGINNVKLYLNNVLVRQENVASYDWGLGTNDPQLNTLTPGTYTLKALAEATSADTASTSIKFTIKAVVTGIENLDETSELILYPNPVADMLYFSKRTQWELFTSNGLKINNGESIKIDMQTLGSGVYILKTGIIVHKIIKE